MSIIASRINSSGTYFVNGTFDEVTFSNTSPVIKNLLRFTEQFDNAFWSKARASIGSVNTILSPNGTLTADTLIEDNIASQYKGLSFQISSGLNNSLTYTVSAYAKSANRNFEIVIKETGTYSRQAYIGFSLSAGTVLYTSPFNGITVNSSSITNADNGWYRCSVTYTIGGIETGQFFQFNLLNGVLSSSNNYTGDGVSSIALWGAQLELGSTTTIYQGIAATNTLITPTFKNKVTPNAVYVTDIFDEVTYNRTFPVIKNLLVYTDDFSQWLNDGNIITTNQDISPDGNFTADRIQATGNYTAILNNPSVGGASYTFSFWVKSVSGATGTWGINYFNGAHNRTTVPITGEWSRQSFTFTGTGGQFNIYIADNRSGLASITDAYVWGAQLERGTVPTIYQGIAAADTLVAPGFVKRETSDGTIYVTGSFDEVTGIT